MAAQLDASDAALDGFVPSLDHASFADWDAVYEPAEDTFLLLDALFAERSSLRALGDATVVEVGPGSGVVSAYVAALLAAQAPRVVCVDVNPRACALSARTAAANGARVDVVRGDLATRVRRRPSAARKASRGARRCLARGSVDVLVFNPPYVPTPRAEVGGAGIEASWAGGDRGREVLDRLLPDVTRALSPRGRFYVVVVEENDPDDIARILAADGLERTTVATKRARPRARAARGAAQAMTGPPAQATSSCRSCGSRGPARKRAGAHPEGRCGRARRAVAEACGRGLCERAWQSLVSATSVAGAICGAARRRTSRARPPPTTTTARRRATRARAPASRSPSSPSSSSWSAPRSTCPSPSPRASSTRG
ncbi:N6-adenine specific methyltransferase-like protein, HemK [Aureococcus anophagefferens]|uniref:N6-adenine specific methyltransferase-like protein, HemK n=1 Tax=Aureococcus anophagefferens TaxID=44056 RepID=F0Y8M3_AURAN|nr:N6-adenine specific methyltransferase-like protein, HemK [Aureococcus anophagefferens]EGB08692.1 N6-adenine specific methyltransferase-like protein, HemK [Aureococcus anophagefferens]|eukprot:XP_009036681.1 N6-adenine specific methyltransferase-like protein, HemK [Aureococcus anophagefferens]